jgi:hypothetical protein
MLLLLLLLFWRWIEGLGMDYVRDQGDPFHF